MNLVLLGGLGDDSGHAQTAVSVHRVPVTSAGRLPRLDQAALAGLPAQIVTRATRLHLPGHIAATAGVLAR